MNPTRNAPTPIATFLAVSLILASVAGAWAQGEAKPGDEAKKVVSENVDKVLKILRDPAYKDDKKRPEMRAEIRDTLLKVVDMERIGLLTLATYRKKLSDAEFKEFTEVFSKLLFATYITHLEKYSGEAVTIGECDIVSDLRVDVKTTTVSGSSSIPVDFSMFREKVGAKWALYDVKIEGVSLVRNYRTQFKEILGKKSVDKFLQQLRDKVESNDAAQ